jgi:hypothetical protein
MIPTLFAFGLIFGRWWRASLAVGVIGWAVVIPFITDAGPEGGIVGTAGLVVGAAGLALVNTAVGVAVHQGVLWAVRTARERSRHATTA